MSQTSIRPPHYSSTPYSNRNNNKLTEFNALLASSMLSSSTSEAAISSKHIKTVDDYHYKSILLLLVKGADINRSYLEANKSDLSMADLSNWLHTKRPSDSMRNRLVSIYLYNHLYAFNFNSEYYLFIFAIRRRCRRLLRTWTQR